MASFDIVNEINAQEVDNAVNNTLKEINTRYDFRGLHTEVTYHKNENRIHLVAAESMKMKAIKEMLIKNFVKRGIDSKVLEFGDEEGTSQGHLKMDVALKEGIDRETAKKIVKEIKTMKMKVQPQIQDNQVRVTGKKIDDLQAAIKELKSKDMGIPLQFVNFK
ncbi:MAG: YajQ family cyclic di-GMP-binding protein [Balneolaceae bacterium]|nr:YajQ family cyclic di-GMP-binding protein [Balneolaceae bacterium]MBO6546287.1 YajQ family cyclic di-GMP-binding protein [Balneolaceae bacterium]MBO6648646.1 YajQ family cyclic di-GMP-binding protein [Balneolaceae bacterium]